MREIALLASHPLVLLNMPHSDCERHRCARYLHHLGYSGTQIGVLITATLLGSAVITLRW